MIYRVHNKKHGPVQLALRTRDGNGTQLIVIPPGSKMDIPEERYSEQITNLEQRGDIIVTKIYDKQGIAKK